MLSTGCEQVQILWPVVASILVDMVDALSIIQGSGQALFGYEDVFINVILLVPLWMIS